MPIYFSDVAPTCPLSIDGLHGPGKDYILGRPQFMRPVAPRATDFPSALQSANIIRNILISLTTRKTVNNVIDNIHDYRVNGSVSVAKDKFKNKTARWTEQKDKRVKRKYKYFGKDRDGNVNKAMYVTMERIERMVWYDKGWKAYMTWEYGPKGEGEPIGGASGPSGAGSGAEDSGGGGE